MVKAHLSPGESQRLLGVCRVWGSQVSVEALRLSDGQFLVVISPDPTEALVKDYALRWGIESSGFLRLGVFVLNRLT